MEIKEKIEDLLLRQKEITGQYEELTKEFTDSDPLIENNILKKQVEKYQKLTEDLEKKQGELLKENMLLKISLKEQMINEKTTIANSSKRKVELYFKDEMNKEYNKLQLLQQSFTSKLIKLKGIANKELKEDREEFLIKIEELQNRLTELVSLRKQSLLEKQNSTLEEMNLEYQRLKEEEITEEVIKAKQKHNDLEVKIGLNWINKIGILLLLLGVATAAKYTYSTWFNEYLRAITFFLMGGVMLGAGEWMNKKGKSIFALGLCGGGIGILYFSIFSSYFMLEILNMEISILLSVLITFVALALSQRYQSMTICGVSLVGGYLPFFSYVLIEGLAGPQIYIAMGYLFILNLLVLGVSLKRRWIYINYLSFILNIPCMLYLAMEARNPWISIIYALLSFMMYLAITLINPIREKVQLKRADLILLALNTMINCGLVYGLFEKSGLQDYRGLLALLYAMAYLVLGQLMYKKAGQEKGTIALFYITAISFSILMIPFQFGVEWASFGWLLEAVLLISYGYKKRLAKMELGGWGILGLCVAAFFLLDFSIFNQWYRDYYTFKYTTMTVGLVYVFMLYLPEFKKDLYRYTRKGKSITGYVYFVIINTLVYILQMSSRIYSGRFYLAGDFYYYVLMALITALFAYGVSRIKNIQDGFVKGIVITLYILVDLVAVSLNFYSVGTFGGNGSRILPMIILVLFNIFAFFNVKHLVLELIKKKGLSIETYPMTLALYLLGVSTAFIMNQFALGNMNLVISLLFIGMSFGYIIYGFKKNFLMIRRFGLGLSIFSTGKLFIFDLGFLDTLGRIIAYFCFGLVLLAISFVYHRLKINLEEKEAKVI